MFSFDKLKNIKGGLPLNNKHEDFSVYNKSELEDKILEILAKFINAYITCGDYEFYFNKLEYAFESYYSIYDKEVRKGVDEALKNTNVDKYTEYGVENIIALMKLVEKKGQKINE